MLLKLFLVIPSIITLGLFLYLMVGLFAYLWKLRASTRTSSHKPARIRRTHAARPGNTSIETKAIPAV